MAPRTAWRSARPRHRPSWEGEPGATATQAICPATRPTPTPVWSRSSQPMRCRGSRVTMAAPIPAQITIATVTTGKASSTAAAESSGMPRARSSQPWAMATPRPDRPSSRPTFVPALSAGRSRERHLPLTVVPRPVAEDTSSTPPTASTRSRSPVARSLDHPTSGRSRPVVAHRERHRVDRGVESDLDSPGPGVLSGVLEGLRAGEVDRCLDIAGQRRPGCGSLTVTGGEVAPPARAAPVGDPAGSERAGIDPPTEVVELGQGADDRRSQRVERRRRPGRLECTLPASQTQIDAEGHQVLLRAVVDVSCQAMTLRVGSHYPRRRDARTSSARRVAPATSRLRAARSWTFSTVRPARPTNASSSRLSACGNRRGAPSGWASVGAQLADPRRVGDDRPDDDARLPIVDGGLRRRPAGEDRIPPRTGSGSQRRRPRWPGHRSHGPRQHLLGRHLNGQLAGDLDQPVLAGGADADATQLASDAWQADGHHSCRHHREHR